MTAGSHKPVHPHLPKTDDRCVRLIIDFPTMEALVGFARKEADTLRLALYTTQEDELHVYKVTAAQYHSVPVGNHYIVAEGGHADLKLTPDRIASILPSAQEVAEEENYNDHRDQDTL